MTRTPLHLTLISIVILNVSATSAAAQVLGTFRWKFAPYCNVVTLQVEQRGSVLQLAGTDDGCGDPATAAMATGSASLNAGGTVDLSLSLIRRDGIPVTTAMSISQATLSGTWKDNWGNSGALTFNPAAPVSGSPRPLTLRGDWSIFFRSAVALESSMQSLSFSQPLSSGPSTVEIVPTGGGPTTACPGTLANPQALPGVLCLYQTVRQNVANLQVFNTQTGVLSTANTFGASVVVTASTGQSTIVSYGAWALGVR